MSFVPAGRTSGVPRTLGCTGAGSPQGSRFPSCSRTAHPLPAPTSVDTLALQGQGWTGRDSPPHGRCWQREQAALSTQHTAQRRGGHGGQCGRSSGGSLPGAGEVCAGVARTWCFVRDPGSGGEIASVARRTLGEEAGRVQLEGKAEAVLMLLERGGSPFLQPARPCRLLCDADSGPKLGTGVSP